jgi:hypothetical protein
MTQQKVISWKNTQQIDAEQNGIRQNDTNRNDSMEWQTGKHLAE